MIWFDLFMLVAGMGAGTAALGIKAYVSKHAPEPPETEDTILARSIKRVLIVDPDGWHDDGSFITHDKLGVRIWKESTEGYANVTRINPKNRYDTNRKALELDQHARRIIAEGLKQWGCGDKEQLRLQADRIFDEAMRESRHDSIESGVLAGRVSLKIEGNRPRLRG